jgi:hypothetical protein
VKKYLAKITAFGLIAAVLALTPGVLSAQDATTTNAPAQSTPKKAKKHSLTFHGKVSAVDVGTETLTVHTLKFNITSTTRIMNATNGEPAILSDITVGENVSGSYLKDTNGQLNAKSIYIGGKSKKKKAASSDTGSNTNSSSTNSVSN